MNSKQLIFHKAITNIKNELDWVYLYIQPKDLNIEIRTSVSKVRELSQRLDRIVRCWEEAEKKND